METTIFEVEFYDGRIFRIWCANSTQKKRFFNNLLKIQYLFKSWRELTSGIHTISQCDKIIEFENKQS